MTPLPPFTPPSVGVAGDFLSLLKARDLLPLPGQNSASKDWESTQATTIFAFHYQDGVLLVGDRRATAGHMIVTDEIEKLVELDPYSMMAIAGVPAMAFEMARILSTSFAYYRRSQLQPLSLSAKVRALSRLLHDNLPLTLQGVGMVAPIFCGYDALFEDGKPQIYFYDPLGAQFQAVLFAASGSGSMTLRGVLSFQERFGSKKLSQMSLAEATRFALQALIIAAEFDSATGGVQPESNRFATIKSLSSTGVQTLSPKEQALYFQQTHD